MRGLLIQLRRPSRGLWLVPPGACKRDGDGGEPCSYSALKTNLPISPHLFTTCSLPIKEYFPSNQPFDYQILVPCMLEMWLKGGLKELMEKPFSLVSAN